MSGLREQLGLTQKDFAAYLGVGRRTLIRWEMGGAWPRGLAYNRLLNAAREAGYPPPPPRED